MAPLNTFFHLPRTPSSLFRHNNDDYTRAAFFSVWKHSYLRGGVGGLLANGNANHRFQKVGGWVMKIWKLETVIPQDEVENAPVSSFQYLK